MRRLALGDLHREAGAVLGKAGGAEVVLRHGEPRDEAARARREPVVSDRSQRGRLSLSGKDRVEFLHGQSSNDVRRLGEGEGHATTFLTGKGKMRAAGVVYARAHDLLVSCEAEALGPLVAHLESFLIMEEVKLEDESADTVELLVHGPGAAAALAAALGVEVPAGLAHHHFATVPWDGGTLLVAAERPTGETGFALIARAPLGPGLWTRLAAVLPAVGWEALETLRVEAGIPRFGADLDQDTIPVEAGLEDSISYDKGCFTGYEVLARIRTYGHVNRRLVGLRVEGGEPPLVGAEVRRGDRRVGEVTSSAWSPLAGGPIALAMVRREAAEPGVALELGPGAGARAAVTALPFAPRE